MDSYTRFTDQQENNFTPDPYDDSYEKVSDETTAFEGGNNRYRQMNTRQEKYDSYQGSLTPKTKLIQIYCNHPEEAPRLVSESRGAGETPLLVIINQPSCICCCPCTWAKCMRNIPQGMLILETTWGQDSGLMEPGLRCCYPWFKEVKVCISRNTIRYNCPITDVVTKDNVHVSLDMGVNFHIGKHKWSFQEDARRFFYNFGPNRLDELLSEEMDEAIRDFIRQYKVAKVRDIKSELTKDVQYKMQQKFQPYGVVIDQINCMNIILPKELRKFLQATTNYDVFLQKQVKQQDNKMLMLNNNENKRMLQQKRDNFQLLMTLIQKTNIAEIEQLGAQIEMETKQEIRIIQANQVKNVKIIEAENILRLAKARAEQKASKITKEAKAYSERQNLIAALEKEKILATQVRLETAISKCPAIIKEAEANGAQEENLQPLRKFDEQMALTNGLIKTAGQSKIIVSGDQGKEILSYLVKTMDSVE